jgi:hypothetical protein
MEVLDRHHRAQERLCAPEIEIAIHRVGVAGFDEFRDH